MKDFKELLTGGDLRSIGKCRQVISKVKSQHDFDALFKFLFFPDRVIVMHAADAIEKITIEHPGYLAKHKVELIKLLQAAKHIELKWHLGLLISRLELRAHEFDKVWGMLTGWAKDKTHSRLVRVGAVQGLFELAKKRKGYAGKFISLAGHLEKQNIPSVNARIRNIRKEMVGSFLE